MVRKVMYRLRSMSAGGLGLLITVAVVLSLTHLLLCASLYQKIPSSERVASYERKGFTVEESEEKGQLLVTKTIGRGDEAREITRDIGAFIISAYGLLTLPLVAIIAIVCGVVIRLLTRIVKVYSWDSLLLAAALLLSGIGLLLLTRLSVDIPHAAPSRFPEALSWPFKQCMVLMVAFLAVPFVVLGAHKLEQHQWFQPFMNRRLYHVPVYLFLPVLVCFLLGIVKFSGGSVYGASLSLSIAGFTVQIVELAKPLLILFMAYFLADMEENRLGHRKFLGFSVRSESNYIILPVIFIVSLSALILSDDLGLTLICASFLAVTAIAGTGEGFLLVGSALGATAASALIIITHQPAHAFERFQAMVDPFLFSENLARARWSFASGGLFGTGLGNGKPETVPIVDSDFILAAVGEELGLIGLAVVIIGIATVIYRGFQIARRETQPFRKHLSAGIVILLMLQTIVITGGSLGLLPLTGITFPFISRGGMSILVNMILIGLLIQLSFSYTLPAGTREKPYRGRWETVNLRLKITSIISLLLVVPLWFWAFYLMVIVDERDGNRYFEDKNKIAIIEHFIKNNVFYRDKEGIGFDESNVKKAAAELGPHLRRRVSVSKMTLDYRPLRDYTDQLQQSDNGISLIPGSFSISNPRLISQIPFTIIDRKGRKLAYTKNGKRLYPFGSSAFPIIGHARYGVTLFMERDIREVIQAIAAGKPGVSLTWEQMRLRLFSLINGKYSAFKPVESYTVQTTIDIDVQGRAMKALGKRRGVVIAILIPEGEVICLASAPSFDPSKKQSREEYDKAFSDNDLKLTHNRALHDWYPPGSIMKIVTGAALCEYLPQRIANKIHCNGYDDKLKLGDYQYSKNKKFKHGNINFELAMAESCNIYFAHQAIALGPYLQKIAENLGFFRPINLIPWSREPQLQSLPSHVLTCHSLAQTEDQPADCLSESPTSTKQLSPDYLSKHPGLVARAGFGQTVVDVTPIHMARAVATIANQGKMPELTLLQNIQVIDDEGNSRSILKSKPDEEKVFSRDTAFRVSRAMEKVYTHGTAKKTVIPWRLDYKNNVYALRKEVEKPVRVAAKTGTAQVEGEKSHAWFVAFAPAQNPRIAVLVLIENGGSGGFVAGPLGMQILRDALKSVDHEDKETK